MELKKKDNIIKKYQEKFPKGSQCSVSGLKYEKRVLDVLKCCKIDNDNICDLNEIDLGGSTSSNDLVCSNENFEVGIEIKKFNTPDWMQCSLLFKNGEWLGSKRGKIPQESRQIFEELLKDKIIFNGQMPPKNITHQEWLKIKNNGTWNDHYFDIPSNTIARLYSYKNCYYIQVSNYGLYHLGNDIYNLGVPKFKVKSRIRVRIKVHAKKDRNGYCKLSVTAAAQPKNISELPKSPYSFDDKSRLPKKINFSK